MFAAASAAASWAATSLIDGVPSSPSESNAVIAGVGASMLGSTWVPSCGVMGSAEGQYSTPNETKPIAAATPTARNQKAPPTPDTPFAAPAALAPDGAAAIPVSMAFHNASSWPGLPGSAWWANRPFSMSSQDFMFSFLSSRRPPLPWAQTAVEPIFSPSPNAAGTALARWPALYQSPHD